MNSRILLIITVMSICVAGCGPKTTNIDVRNDDGKAVMELDYRDFDQAASQMVQSMIASGALKKQGGGRYVVATGRIVNDTMQRVDTNQLMAKIEQELMSSGQVVMTSAIGSESDALIHQTRELRDSEEFDQDTIAKRGTLIAPELTISGKIFQKNLRYDRKRQQVEYYFQLKVSDVNSGLRYWMDEKVIGKRGSNKSVPW
ncbi:MAG: penicillin-binding protein activator LpoB [Planctomycetota bacterium]|jgi:uncharacterized protein (TIGR02722 family)